MQPIDGKIRILIVDDVPESRDGLSRLLSFEPDMDVVGFAATGAEGIEMAQKLNPDVILMDINMPDMDGITATEQITQLVPASVVMISVQSDRDYLRRAIQVGAKDFLPKPPSADELYATVRNAYVRKPTPAAASSGRSSKTTQAKKAGKIVVVYSPQGGSGASTLAVNLASSLMSEQQRVVLIDANLQFGDLAVHLAIRNERNIADLAKAAESDDELDPDLIENVLSTHGTGLHLLPAPQTPQDADLVSPSAFNKVVQAMASRFSYVVVDTHVYLNDITVNLFEMADMLIIVGVPTLPCVRNIKVTLDLLTQFGEFDSDKIVFVMNKMPADKKAGALDPEQIAKTLKLKVAGVIPSAEKAMFASLNRGVPVIVNPRQSPGREIVDLAASVQRILVGNDEDVDVIADPTPKRGGFLGRFG